MRDEEARTPAAKDTRLTVLARGRAKAGVRAKDHEDPLRPESPWRLANLLKAVGGLAFAPILLPLGPEGDRSVRRQPWVSYAVVLLCLLGLQYQLLAEPGPAWEESRRQSITSLTGYLREHPCLAAPRDVTDAGYSGALGEFHAERARACAERRTPGWTWQEDPELNRLVADVRSVERAHPVWHLLDRSVDGVDFAIVTSMFLHAGWLHLLGNLLFFWSVAPFLEDVYGRVAFATLYLASGVAGGLAMHYSDPGDTLFALGASGAVSGVMGAFLVRFGKRRLRLLSAVSPWLPFLHYRFSLPACVILVFWFLQDVRGARLGIPGIGWWAHIGGFLFGVAFAHAFKWLRVEERHIAPGIEGQIAWQAHPALVKAIEMRVQGRYRAARRGVELALAAQPGNLDAWRERYELAITEARWADAGLDAARLVGLYVKASEARLAARFVETVLEQIGPELPPRFYLVAGAQMDSAGEAGTAQLVYDCLRHRHPLEPAAPLTLIREARGLEREGATEDARARYEAAHRHPACTAALREAAERARVRLEPAPPVRPARCRRFSERREDRHAA